VPLEGRWSSTQKQWKLFVENRERNAVLTFPYADKPDQTPHGNSSLCRNLETHFLEAIVICLLAGYDPSVDNTA